MMTRIVVSVCVCCFALPVLGQTTQPSGALVGDVIGASVNVRCVPSLTDSYICAQVHQPAKVTVLGKQDKWLKIAPVPGCYSVISKQFVQLDASGQAGTVTGNNVSVRSAGDMAKGAKLGDFWGLQCQLNKGDKVQILPGSGSDYYKIISPGGTYFWLHSDYVDLKGQAPEASVAPRPPDAGSSEAGLPARTPDRTPTTAPRRATSRPAVDPESPWGKLQATEKDIQAEYGKPAGQRNFLTLSNRLKTIEPGDDKYLKQVIDYYQAHLQRSIDLKQSKEVLDRQISDTMARETEYQAILAKITAKTAGPGPTVYDADGVLTASGLFTGSGGIPKRWVVRDTVTGRITAYVQCTGKDDSGKPLVDMDKYVGQAVGIKGDSTFDKGLALFVVDAKELRPLPKDNSVPAAPSTEAPKPVKDGEDPDAPAEKPAPAAPAAAPTTQPTTLPSTGLPSAG